MFRLPPEIVKLLEAAASHPEGESALFEGHLESVAALYQVHPRTVERLRAAVGSPAAHAKATEILASARLNPSAAAQTDRFQPHEVDAAALIAKASALPNGLELLTRGPIETAAVQLGTHPFVVEEARLHLAARVESATH
jgi:hypothetical protein